MASGAEPVRSHASGITAPRAEALGAALPPLIVAAERVAATVAQGVHSRRRVGQGESFWQFRPFLAGDAPNRIDWRQSAKSDRAFVRETEWEAAQTIYLWRGAGAGLRWRSRADLPLKQDRAGLLLLALASLLLRGGERVWLGEPQGDGRATGRPVSGGRHGLDRMARALAQSEQDEAELPPVMRLPRHAHVVLISDFLAPLDALRTAIGRLAAIPVTGHVLQVLDPAETALPYTGRIRFLGLHADETPTLIPRVERIREEYSSRLAAHQSGLAAICAAAGLTFGMHRTDHGPETALLGTYMSLAPR